MRTTGTKIDEMQKDEKKWQKKGRMEAWKNKQMKKKGNSGRCGNGKEGKIK